MEGNLLNWSEPTCAQRGLTESRVRVAWSLTLVFMSFLPPACRPGTYKASATDAYCNKCPSHSSSPQEQAVECTCEKGFYRAEADPRAMACTRESCKHRLLLQFNNLTVSCLNPDFCAFISRVTAIFESQACNTADAYANSSNGLYCQTRMQKLDGFCLFFSPYCAHLHRGSGKEQRWRKSEELRWMERESDRQKGERGTCICWNSSPGYGRLHIQIPPAGRICDGQCRFP